MSVVNHLADQVIEYAERASAMADAAQGKKRIRSTGVGRWLLLPAAGAGVYAVVRSGSFSRQARGAVEEVRSRASELPDELMGRVRQSQPTRTSTSRNGTARRPRKSTSTTSRKRSTRAKTSS